MHSGCSFVFFFQAEDGIRDLVRSRGLGDVYKRQALNFTDDSIQLLHRTSRGWVPVGDTPFAAPDLDLSLIHI